MSSMSPPGIYRYAVAAMKQISEPTVNLGALLRGRSPDAAQHEMMRC
jgi:hypothetical protein